MLCIFFFKQKTAYEMRISDWSSDVCSSDLNALAIARWLKAQPQVSWVSYAGLEDDRYHALQQRYMPKGGGAVFTFGLKGGRDAGIKLVGAVKLFSHLANIGDPRSLIIHPASTTHSQLEDEALFGAGAGPAGGSRSTGVDQERKMVGWGQKV